MIAQTPVLTQTAPSDAEACDAPAGGAEDWARPPIERQLALLGRLAEAGLEIALAIERQATGMATSAGAQGDTTAVARGDIALAYARVARAVRMTVALQSKRIKELQALEEGAARALVAAEAEEDDARLDLEDARKARVERIVTRVIKAQLDDEDAVERLADEASERLDDEDLYGDVLARPFSEIVADICRDLGLDPDWSRLAQEPWAREEIDSGQAGAPLAAPPARGAEARPPYRHPTDVRRTGRGTQATSAEGRDGCAADRLGQPSKRASSRAPERGDRRLGPPVKPGDDGMGTTLVAQQLVGRGLGAGLGVDALDDHGAVEAGAAVGAGQGPRHHHRIGRHLAAEHFAGGAVDDLGR
jgi:hypothetical protein